MKKHNIEIVKQLSEDATPMTKFYLPYWLKTNLAETDIASTVNQCVGKMGFEAQEVVLSDGHGASRKIIVPLLAAGFAFGDAGIYATYGIISPSTRVGNKNMYVLTHEKFLSRLCGG